MLTDDLKSRHPGIPWRKVAGIGNVLRVDCGNIAAPIMWALVREDLPLLDQICCEELVADRTRGSQSS